MEAQRIKGDYIEGPCVIEHNGNRFSGGGAYLLGDRCLAYVDANIGNMWRPGTLKTWHGEEIGTYRTTAKWERYGKFGRIRMAQIHATINDKEYTGRLGYDWNEAVILRAVRS